MTPDAKAVASLPSIAIGSMTESRSAWMEWLGRLCKRRTFRSCDPILMG
jgi:hypothetical protein